MQNTSPVHETVETVAELLAKQNVVPAWMRDAVNGLKPTDAVLVSRYALPIGSYVIAVKTVA